MTLSLGETDYALERTPDGRRLVVRRVVDAPIDVVWEVLTDTEQWPDWGLSITAVELPVRRGSSHSVRRTAVESPDRYITAETRGRVRALGAVWLPFEITSCENYRWTWTVARVPATGHFVETHPTGSVVGFEVPPLAVGYVPVCQRACARIAAIAASLGEKR
ncbi:SRPBCC family protein [Haloarcula onubensis]|uniref:SRPBCC family protein n=1 Tax=Haloarcula onubensis TaxID=2950539 RepID=A0ABU2FLR7_9EURY|nr:SRPBCC family protein [Halomicroarcula sp. S3CR25-11]MDS0281697.1 SRPBCC family protein [Halomicroarcula sp. S3CR25-11]